MDNVSIKKGVKPKFSHMIDEPIPMYGDNDTATSNAKECRITLVEMGKNGPKYQQTLGEALVTRYIIRYV